MLWLLAASLHDDRLWVIPSWPLGFLHDGDYIQGNEHKYIRFDPLFHYIHLLDTCIPSKLTKFGACSSIYVIEIVCATVETLPQPRQWCPWVQICWPKCWNGNRYCTSGLSLSSLVSLASLLSGSKFWNRSWLVLLVLISL